MREAYFACSTPYQVIGAISIALADKLDADLYVFGMFPKYEQICERIRSLNIFSNVYAVDSSKIGNPKRLEGFLLMMFAEKTVSPFLPKDAVYETYYSSSRALPKTILQRVLLKRNPKMTRVIYEDGLGTYVGNSHVLNASKLTKRAEKVLGWHLDDPDNTRIMAYMPSLVQLPEYLQGHEVEQMPRLQFNDGTSEMLGKVFDVNDEKIINEKFIIFDTLRPNVSRLTDEHFRLLDESYEACRVAAADDHNIVVKPHPRSWEKSNAEIRLYPYQELPMEVLYARMTDLDDRILVAYSSSAVFTPKILFDKEPTVISLHRILKGTRGSILFEGIYNKFRNAYSDREKVMAPDSVDELKKILETIK